MLPAELFLAFEALARPVFRQFAAGMSDGTLLMIRAADDADPAGRWGVTYRPPH